MESFKIEKIQKIIDSKEAEELLECIKSLEEFGITSIGEGLNANVYAALETNFDRICFKKKKERPELIFNDIDKEHEYQIMAYKAGVRTPLSLVSIRTEKEELIIMQRIIGFTIEEILENPKLLPEKFNYDKFCLDLDEQIAKLHAVELYHRDLHFKNIMINEEGLPVIIDFGTATTGTGGELTYRDYVSIFNDKKGHYESVENIFDDDLVCIKNIKRSLNKLK